MTHLITIPANNGTGGAKDMLRRATGRFYTPDWMAAGLVDKLDLEALSSLSSARVIDPFCGDGRLLAALADRIASMPSLRAVEWRFELWDNDVNGLDSARANVTSALARNKLRGGVSCHHKDSFLESKDAFGTFDIVLTNPPWEAIKPDRRELKSFSPGERGSYERALKSYDLRLAEMLPRSQPDAKLYGWGTNLSRCGLELSLELLSPRGICGIVLPSSILADQVSIGLRRWMLRHFRLCSIDCFPAETKPFEQVDQPCVAAVLKRGADDGPACPVVTRFDRNRIKLGSEPMRLSADDLEKLSYRIPAELSSSELSLLLKFSAFPTLAALDTTSGGDLWLGRELDETGYQSFTSDKGTVPFAKGRHVQRFVEIAELSDFIRPGARAMPESAAHERVAWRDVSRRSQARRMVATIIPAGIVTGNSLHVAYFRTGGRERLKALLGVMNSLAFEFQLRSRLGTGHVSLGSVRGVHVPDLDDPHLVRCLAPLVDRARAGDATAEVEIEIALASAFGLSADERAALLGHFNGLGAEFRDYLRSPQAASKNGNGGDQPVNMISALIPNHYTARLSELDLKTALAVPPGGNWKNIPESVPSKRLESIRVSYAAGGGSRSTYYGRLHPDRPSYTINTYFNRPGNGCHLHFDFAGGQHRVLSEREAARLQSFPDSFVFAGSHVSIHKQIGNAVPPLLAYQIARQLQITGQYVDLFSGAGGLSLGFKWAGWRPLVANDIEPHFLGTYQRNIHPVTVCGDIRQKSVFDEIVRHGQDGRSNSEPFFVIGGPPCQGFSTAGKRRTLDDDRNHLFNEFKHLVQTFKPDGFIFENVTGLLNMDKGAVFEMIKKELAIAGNRLTAWILQAEEYGVPQRRTRLVLVSVPASWPAIVPPAPITSLEKGGDLFGSMVPAVSVADALSDLPDLAPGEDGSAKAYRFAPKTSYQRLMRGVISPAEYLAGLSNGGGLSR